MCFIILPYYVVAFIVFAILHLVDFAGGKAHQGIAQSALRVWESVQAQVEKQLREHADYKLVLTGACASWMSAWWCNMTVGVMCVVE